MNSIESLIEEVRQCQTCALHLPHGTRPVLQASREARLLIASQAPGSKVHASGVPFADPSGDRLRAWTGLSDDIFCDAQSIAILPMGFCYPGRSAGGDAPPRRECAPLWRSRLLAHMPHIRLTLLVGSYAQAAALGPGKVEERVRHYRDYLPDYFPLPHPSWRSQIWIERNRWFESDVLPALKSAVRQALGKGQTMTEAAALSIYTIGHSTRTIEVFVDILRAVGVTQIVDIRSHPRSRTNPQYNLDTLPRTLEQYQIGHVYLKDLGGRRPRQLSVDPATNGFWKNQSFHNYADYATTKPFQVALAELLERGGQKSSAIMCSEAVWWRCHRRIVADYLLNKGCAVYHLMGAGRVEPAKMTPAATPVESCLIYPD